jgi:hypothetical protein
VPGWWDIVSPPAGADLGGCSSTFADPLHSAHRVRRRKKIDNVTDQEVGLAATAEGRYHARAEPVDLTRIRE